MKVVKNYLYNAIYQLFKVLIPFITIPYLSRVLGPNGIGINSYTNSIIQYFILFGDLGITVYGNRKVAYVRNDKYKLTQVFYEIMIMQIITVSVSYLAFFIFLIFTKQYRPFYLAQSILIIASACDISWFFMGIENFRVTVLRNFIVRLLIICCIFIFVKSYNDLLLYIILYGLSFLIGNITLFYGLRKYIGIPDVLNLNIFQHLKPSVILFIPNIFMEIYLVLNKTMLGIFDNVDSAGFYDQSDKVVKMILSIVTATGTVMLPHVANAFAKGKKRTTIQYLYDSFSFVTALSIPMAFGLAAISYTFVPVFFGRKFFIVVYLMMIESSIIVLIAWGNAIGTQYLIPTKQTNKFTVSVIVGSIINVIVNVPMIIIFGVIGSIIATVISEMSVTCYQLFSIRNQVSFKKLFSDSYKDFIAGIIMFITIFEMNIHLTSSWMFLAIEIFTGMIIYTGLIYLLKSHVFIVVRKYLHN